MQYQIRRLVRRQTRKQFSYGLTLVLAFTVLTFLTPIFKKSFVPEVATALPPTASSISFVIAQNISKSVGPVSGGNRILIEGVYFDSTTTVKFGNVPAGIRIMDVYTTEIVVPASATGAGTVSLTVTNNQGSTTWDNLYTYKDSDFTVNSVSPNSGPVSGGGQATITSDDLNIKWKKISAGGSHTCALTWDGKAYCWGNNSSGELGNGTTTNQSSPTLVLNGAIPSSASIDDIAAGTNHTCVIAATKVYCWGNNGRGQLGNNSTNNSSVPVAVKTSASVGQFPSGSVRAVKIRTNYYGSCAVLSNNTAYCWGYNTTGRFGNDSTSPNVILPDYVRQPDGYPEWNGWKDIALGQAHSCAITAGVPDGTTSRHRVYCSGSNSSGQLGNNSYINSSRPVYAVLNDDINSTATSNPLEIAVGREHSCATTATSIPGKSYQGSVYCWGRNDLGQLGVGDRNGRNHPTSVDLQRTGSYDVAFSRNISSYYDTTCVQGDNRLDDSKYSELFCWGSNTSGQLGNGMTGPANGFYYPVAVLSMSTNTSRVSVGWSHTCALDLNFNSFCWGNDNSGRLGVGTLPSYLTPSMVETKQYTTRFGTVDTSQATSLTNTSLSVTVPANTVGAKNVYLTNTMFNRTSEILTNGYTYYTTPSAPTITSITPGNKQITVSWSVPNNGGSAITSYNVRYRTGAGEWVTLSQGPAVTECTVTGLLDNTNYEFEVRANNAAGAGDYSAMANATTWGLPGAPLNFTATPGSNSIMLN